MASDAQVAHVVRQTMAAYLGGEAYVSSWIRCDTVTMVAASIGIGAIVRTADQALVEGNDLERGDVRLELGPLHSIHIEMDGPVHEHVRVFYRTGLLVRTSATTPTKENT